MQRLNVILQLNVNAKRFARDRNPFILLYFTGQDSFSQTWIVRLNRMVSVWCSFKEHVYLRGLICWRFVKTVPKLWLSVLTRTQNARRTPRARHWRQESKPSPLSLCQAKPVASYHESIMTLLWDRIKDQIRFLSQPEGMQCTDHKCVDKQ